MSDAQYPIRNPAIVPRAIETARTMPAVLWGSLMGAVIAGLTLGTVPSSAQQLTNGTLFAPVNRQDGSYQFGPIGSRSTLQASISALIDHTWLRPGSYP